MASNSPCAACKCLRRKCVPNCAFAPYFPPDQPQKFTNVHKVFGASNVSKLLNELPTPAQKEDAVNSLAYEAEARLRDPVYGCVGVITTLSDQLQRVQQDLYMAKKELSHYLGPNAMIMNPLVQPTSTSYILQQYQHHPHHQINPSPSMGPYGTQPHNMGIGGSGVSSQAQLVIREPHQQRMDLIESQHLAAVFAREQEMMRTYEQQQKQQQQQQQLELVRFHNQHISGFDSTSADGLNQVSAGFPASVPVIQFENQFQLQQQHQHQQMQSEEQLQQASPPQRQLLIRAKSEEDTSAGPSA